MDKAMRGTCRTRSSVEGAAGCAMARGLVSFPHLARCNPAGLNRMVPAPSPTRKCLLGRLFLQCALLAGLVVLVPPAAVSAGPTEGEVFRDCDGTWCPEMVVVPAGSFMMGSPSGEKGRDADEGPVHRVRISEPFAVGVYEVTFEEWEACRRGGGCSHNPDDKGWGRGRRPVINVSWQDAQAYVRWLSRVTGKAYRLLSESEWEYVARAGTTGPFHFGSTITTEQANYGSNRGRTAPVGSFPANAFGLHDVHGNVMERVEDCWHASYRGAPGDGSAWTRGGNCDARVLRGGSWYYGAQYLRSANRYELSAGNRFSFAGFRVARTLD